MATTDTLPQGVPYAIGAALVAALKASPVLAGAQVLDNPVRLTDLADGPRIVFFEDASDDPLDQNGNAQKRVYGFTVGVISRNASNPRLSAHGDYRAVKRVLIGALAALKPAVNATSLLREGRVSYRLENIDVGGALVVGNFTVDYRDSSN